MGLGQVVVPCTLHTVAIDALGRFVAVTVKILLRQAVLEPSGSTSPHGPAM